MVARSSQERLAVWARGFFLSAQIMAGLAYIPIARTLRIPTFRQRKVESNSLRGVI